jgi:opacity protein-like surface antigen
MIRKGWSIALLLLAGPALAADISYNYGQLGYQWVTLEDVLPGLDVDGDGFGFGGSFEVGDRLFIQAGYQQTSFDYGIDFDQISAGVGYHVALSQSTDFFAALSYVAAEVSVSGGGSAKEDGYGATIGVRAMVTEKLELDGSISYVDLGDGADGTAFGAAAIYNVTEIFSLGLDVGFEEDAVTYGVGVRVYIGK